VSNLLPVYLAGPDVFLPDAAEIGRRKLAICAAHGLDGRYPGAGIDLVHLAPDEHARALFEGCIEMMDACVAGLANLTPFRGPSADVGTAFEMGYLFGRGLSVFGYTSEVCDYASRVDDELLMVESFGLADNLMLEGPMLRRELAVVRVAEHGPSSTAAFAAFELTVRLAAAELGAEPTRPAPSP
jgi:nucleoside 2-deoxyribosyltransferase